jgi:hypothetical protein
MNKRSYIRVVLLWLVSQIVISPSMIASSPNSSHPVHRCSLRGNSSMLGDNCALLLSGDGVHHPL